MEETHATDPRVVLQHTYRVPAIDEREVVQGYFNHRTQTANYENGN